MSKKFKPVWLVPSQEKLEKALFNGVPKTPYWLLPPKIEQQPRKSALKKANPKFEGNFIQRISNFARSSTKRKKSVEFVDDEEIDAVRNSGFLRVSSIRGRSSSPELPNEFLDEVESLSGSNDSDNEPEDAFSKTLVDIIEAWLEISENVKTRVVNHLTFW